MPSSSFSSSDSTEADEQKVNALQEQEHKKAKEALDKERSILKGIIEHTGAMMAYFDLDFNFVVVNSSYAQGAGYSIGELVGKNHFILFPNKENQAIFEKVRDTGEPVKFLDNPFEFAIQPKRGTTYWDWTLSPVKNSKGKIQGLVLTLMDTTERKKTEEVRKESEERLNMAQKIAHVGSWEYSTKEDKAVWSKEMFNIFCLKPQPYGPDANTYVKLIHPEDCEKVNTTMERVLFKGNVGDKASFDYRILRPDGSVRTLHSERMIREVDQDGKSTRIMGAEQDITEHKQAEEKLRLSEEHFRLVAEAAKMMVYETDVSTGKIVAFRGSEELVGYRPDEINFTVDWVLSHMHPDDMSKVLSQFKAVAREGNQAGYAIKYRFLHKNGKYITVQDTAKAIQDETGKTIRLIGGAYNISQHEHNRERIEQYSKHLEELVEERTSQLRNAERLAAIGQTAGMVGHDLRNPLQAIIGEVYLAKNDLKLIQESEPKRCLQESIQSIAEQISYMDKIVSDLQTFVKPVDPHTQIVNLKPLIFALLAQVEVSTNIQTNLQIEDTIAVKADPQLLKRVLINLVTNSLQAMPEGGDLTIKAQDKGTGKVQITVEDTGVGIPEKIKPKMFTPLFTTKAKGQGFGLAVCKRVIEAQGGTITFESEEDKGTKFIVELPSQ